MGAREAQSQPGEHLPRKGRPTPDDADRDRRLLEAVFAQMPSGVIIAEAPSGRLVKGNDRVAQIFRHEFIEARDISEYRAYKGFHDDGRPYRPDEWPMSRALLHGEVVENEEIKILRGDGTFGFINVSAQPVRDGDGRVVAGVAVFQDTTERKRAEDALAASERRWQWLSDSMPAQVTLAEPDGSMSYINPRWLEFTGAPMEEGLGSGWAQFIHPEDLPALAREYERAVREERSLEMEFRVRGRDGGYCWFLGQMIPVQLEGSGTLKWITVSIDITKRKEQEDERERLLEELRQATAAKDEFLGLVSHEIRTPLTTIMGNAQVITQRGGMLDELSRRAALIDIRDDSERLNRIIENLLILARLDNGQVLQSEPLRVVRVINRVLANHERHYPHRTVIRSWGEDAEKALALVVENYIEQVVNNLVSNAEKYSAPEAPIEVAVSTEGHELAVRVLDRGVGITAEEADKLFKPFFRSPRVADTTPGVGIGLAVCKRLIEVQGGRVWATRRVGRGTETGFSLPLLQDDGSG